MSPLGYVESGMQRIGPLVSIIAILSSFTPPPPSHHQKASVLGVTRSYTQDVMTKHKHFLQIHGPQIYLLSAGAEIEWVIPLPPLVPPPKGGSICAEPELPVERARFRGQKVVPGPDPYPRATLSSTLDTDLSILLSSLRTQPVRVEASPIS